MFAWKLHEGTEQLECFAFVLSFIVKQSFLEKMYNNIELNHASECRPIAVDVHVPFQLEIKFKAGPAVPSGTAQWHDAQVARCTGACNVYS